MMYIGLMIFFIGAMMGDSESLILPVILITIGAVLILKGQRNYIDETTDEDTTART